MVKSSVVQELLVDERYPTREIFLLSKVENNRLIIPLEWSEDLTMKDWSIKYSTASITEVGEVLSGCDYSLLWHYIKDCKIVKIDFWSTDFDVMIIPRYGRYGDVSIPLDEKDTKVLMVREAGFPYVIYTVLL